jgi:hypothetical protein
MEREREQSSVWTKVIYSLALGAAGMYVFDPDKGRRRRAIARDKARSVLLDAREAVGVTQRDVAHRMQGLRARARRLLLQEPVRDDLQLIERVRARMGRLVSHPHAVQVGARRGRVTLSGPILTREVGPLLASVRTVWGVSDVEDRLIAYDRAENIPSLQGGSEPRRTGASAPQESWPPALRGAAVVGGAFLTLSGMHRGSLSGLVLTLTGVGLIVRGVANHSWNTLAERALGTSSPAKYPLVPREQAAATLPMPHRGGPTIYDFPSTGSPLH